jgi:hypothetical protein
VEEGNTAAWARTRVDGFGARAGRGSRCVPLSSRVLCGGPRTRARRGGPRPACTVLGSYSS